MTLPRHPDTGAHFIVVIPFAWGPCIDYSTGYRQLALQLPWLTCIDEHDFLDAYLNHRNDPHVVFVMWSELEVPSRAILGARRCTVAYLYSEALDDRESAMLPAHVEHLRRFEARVAGGAYDAVVVHTPAMKRRLHRRRLDLPVYVVPAGWSPWATGGPTWECPRAPTLVAWGTAGRRVEVMPHVRRCFPDLADASGMFGRALVAEVNRHRAALYIAHSPVASFSTWRLWQALAAGTPLIAESTGSDDTWPFQPIAHFLPIARVDLTSDNLDGPMHQAAAYLRDAQLCAAVALRAYGDYNRWTLEYVTKEFLVKLSPGAL
jgi:hypothetical protein